MRGTIRWRLHVPGEKSTEEEHADDPDAENAGVLEKDTTQCLESEDEEDERMRVENGAAHDATVYAHSVTHSSDVVWASEALVCEMEEVVRYRLRAWKEAVVNARTSRSTRMVRRVNIHSQKQASTHRSWKR
ncbi:hypothetical protein AB1Y20_003491 [Prymnesium parvum]|uniref:Uncharacterized protein n=1 Tax=Prymnesium parvum TaxID=97485 RepID=A0AB34JEN7_PRYPA